MTQANGEFNPFDPTGMLKDMRDANMDSWSKMMVDLVNTDAYAASTGKLLDTWLTNSGPFRAAMEACMTQTLAQLNLPSRDDITRIADRLTNIEMRLDDLDAKLEDSLRPSKGGEN